MSSVFQNLCHDENEFIFRLEDIIVTRYLTGEWKEENKVNEFRQGYKENLDKGKDHLTKYLIDIGLENTDEPYRNFVQYMQGISYYMSTINNDEIQSNIVAHCIEKLKAKFHERIDVYLNVLNIVFNALKMTSNNRLILLKEIIQVCKNANKGYLFAPYLLNIEDLIDLSVLSLEEKQAVYEDFLDIIDNTQRKENTYQLILRYMEQLNDCSEEEFSKLLSHVEVKLLSYVMKVVSSDDRIFDIEQQLNQKCAISVFAKNKQIKESLEIIVSGDIDKINEGYSKAQELYEKNGINEMDYANKVRITKLIEIADKDNQLTYTQISKLLNVEKDDVEFLVIQAIESKFIDALIDQSQETIYLNKVLKRNIGKKSQEEIRGDLSKLSSMLDNFKVQADED